MRDGRPSSAVLLETAHPARDPDGLISKFLRYEVVRSGDRDRRAKLHGTTKDRLSVLLWYIAVYSLRWGRSFSVPLSQAQLRYLNAPLPVDGFPASVSVALWNLLLRERPDLADVTKPDIEDAAVYWWCVEKLPQLNLECKLVTPEQAAVLCRIDGTGERRYPLTVFMKMHIAARPELRCLSLHGSSGRLAALHYFALLAYRSPHLSHFLPGQELEALLDRRPDGTSPFEDNLSFLLRDAPGASDLARSVHRCSTEMVSAPQAMGGHPSSGTDGQGPVEDGVTVIGPIEKTSGLGQATRLSYQILRHGGLPSLSAMPFNVENPALIGFSSAIDYRTYDRPHRVNLFHLNAEAVPLAFALLPRSAFENSYNIGYFFWELDKMPEAHFLALDLLDEIWVSSEYVRGIYAAQTDKPVVNVGMAVEAMPPGIQPHPDFCREGTFTFLATFDAFSFAMRKNPLAVVQAFRTAFADADRSVALIIKTWNRSRVSNAYQVGLWREIDSLIHDDPRIRIIDETFTYDQILAAKAACDCYVSLHRAEGFGFGMLEAMQLGRPVIATAYSGNMDFCTPETCYLVDYDLVSVGFDEYPAVERGSVWAEPKVASAAAAMRAVVANREEAGRRGRRAAQFVKDAYSIRAISRRYARRLDEIRTSHGP